MQTLFVPITAKLEAIAQECETTSFDILERFVSDLTESRNSQPRESQLMVQEYFLNTYAHSREMYDSIKSELEGDQPEKRNS